jgi:flagellar biosynthesis protein FlhG
MSDGRVPPQPVARVIPVGGGKGGVGKTFLVANLAARLAHEGYRVAAIDGDLEGANLHTCLGVPRPRCSLADFVAEREDDIAKLLLETPIENLQLIAATASNLATPQPSHARRVRLVRALRRIPADFVLVDLGAGTHPAVMDYFMIGEDGVVVITPEPTSVENAYAFLRAAFYRRLRLAMVSHDVRTVMTLAMDERNERGIRTPIDLLREVEAIDCVCHKYFGIDAEYLGYINHDEAARRSVRARRPIVAAHPRSDASIYIARIVRKLLVPRPSGPSAPHPGSE